MTSLPRPTINVTVPVNSHDRSEHAKTQVVFGPNGLSAYIGGSNPSRREHPSTNGLRTGADSDLSRRELLEAYKGPIIFNLVGLSLICLTAYVSWNLPVISKGNCDLCYLKITHHGRLNAIGSFVALLGLAFALWLDRANLRKFFEFCRIAKPWRVFAQKSGQNIYLLPNPALDRTLPKTRTACPSVVKSPSRRKGDFSQNGEKEKSL